jgi:glycosyltransferase involved in cell wall biosynthesis
MSLTYKTVDTARLVYARLALRLICTRYQAAPGPFLFAPSLAWEGGLFQRPQQLARSLARQGALVFYLEPVIYRRSNPFKEVEERLYLCQAPPPAFTSIKSPLLYLLTWNRAYQAEFQDPRIIYDYLDALDIVDGVAEQVRGDHRQLLKTAHLVLATAHNLVEEARQVRHDVHRVPNGVDYGHFTAASKPGPTPSDMAAITVLGKPVAGYYGAFGNWFDYSLYRDVARRLPDISFVLIGPDEKQHLASSGLLDLPNVYWLGGKDYADLPAYLRCFDVATIPFVLNELTQATSPVKLFEYMAGRKPVVATPMQECLHFAEVVTGHRSDEFTAGITRALELKLKPAYLEQLDRIASQNTWNERASQILAALDQKPA